MYGVSRKKMLAPFLFITVLFAKQEVVSPQECVKTTQRVLKNNGVIDETFFAPDDVYTIQQLIIGLIEMEKTEICVMAYRLTSQPVVDALVRAKQRGVTIQLVVDSGALAVSHYSKVHYLTNEDVPLYVYQPISFGSRAGSYKSLMHHKCMLFSNNACGGQVVWTGSLNFTHAAMHGNEEFIIIRNARPFYKKFKDNFSRVQGRCECYSLSTGRPYRPYKPYTVQKRSFSHLAQSGIAQRVLHCIRK